MFLYQVAARRLIDIIQTLTPDNPVFYTGTRGDQTGSNCWWIVGGESSATYSEERLSAARSRQDQDWNFSAHCFSPLAYDNVEAAEQALFDAVSPLQEAVADTPRLSYVNADGDTVAAVEGLRWCRLLGMNWRAGDSENEGYVAAAELRFRVVGVVPR